VREKAVLDRVAVRVAAALQAMVAVLQVALAVAGVHAAAAEAADARKNPQISALCRNFHDCL
jgi:hypothetical protein